MGGINRRPDDNRHDDGFDNYGFDDDGFNDDGSDTTPYVTQYTSDDEDYIKNNKKNMIIYCLNIFN